MYTISNIFKGASKLVKSVLNKKQEYHIQFNKEKDGCWYVDFPHWPFSHDNLAMVSRKVASNDTFYISMTAEDGMEIFEFEGRKYKRSVGTVIDEGIVEGKFDDIDLDFVVSWAKHRGGACNILSKSDFDGWWKKLK